MLNSIKTYFLILLTGVGFLGLTLFYGCARPLKEFSGESPTASISQRLEFSASSFRIARGETLNLAGEVSPNINHVEVVWTVSDSTVATVSAAGIVSGLRAGQAIVRVTWEQDRTVSTSVLIDVSSTANLRLSHAEVALYRGETYQLSVQGTGVPSVIWRSMDSNIARINDVGLIRASATANGETVVSAYEAETDERIGDCRVRVQSAVRGVLLSQSSLTVDNGASFGLSASVQVADGFSDALLWESGNNSVVRILSGGNPARLLATGTGRTNVVVRSELDPNQQATVSITVVPAAASGISVFPRPMALVTGAQGQLFATVTPAGSVTWASSRADIASVDSLGLVTGRRSGNAIISVAAASDSSKVATVAVTVSDPEINEVICNPTTVELNKGDTAAISARVFPSEASQNILWSVLDSRIVSLQAGNTRIRAEKPGVTRVKATSINPNIFSFIEVSVRTPAVTAISISPGSLRFFQGQTVKLTATLTPADANQDVIWSSDDVVVADVDSNGNVTGIQPGTTRIIARSVSNPERTAQVTVTVDSIGITSVSVSPSPLDMNLGNTARLTATVVPSTVSDVKWRSSDPNVVRVSTTGNVTAVGRGLNVTVTATSKADDSKAGSSRLSVGGSGYEYRIIDRSYWIPSIGDNSTKRCVFLTPAEIEVIRSQIPDGEIPWLSEIQTAPSGRARYFYLVVYMEEPRSNQFVYLKSIDFVSSKLQIKVTSVNDPQFPVGQPILSNPAYVRLVVEIDTSLLPLAVNTATPIQYTVE